MKQKDIRNLENGQRIIHRNCEAEFKTARVSSIYYPASVTPAQVREMRIEADKRAACQTTLGYQLW